MSRWIQRFLLAAGAGLVVYVAYVEIDRRFYQETVNLHLLSPRPPTLLDSPPRDLEARLEIPRLALSAMVSEGTSELTLRRAVGHIEGTGFPGKMGNVGLAGHRDTFFWPLRNIRRHDLIILATAEGIFRYRVVSTRIVAPSEVSVLAADESEVLTLVTCYPFYFVGMAPNRFIVRATRLSTSDQGRP